MSNKQASADHLLTTSVHEAFSWAPDRLRIDLANAIASVPQAHGDEPLGYKLDRREIDDSAAACFALISRSLPHATPFQVRVRPWLLECFGEMIAGDREERNHRFLEEALELVQSLGGTAGEAHQLVDYVYGREVGEPGQEVGGVMVTLAALCLANGLDMHDSGETELARIWTKVEAIRAKQAAKPKHSPLPEAPAEPASDPCRLLDALHLIEQTAETHYTARNGRRCSIEGSDGEICSIIPHDTMEYIRSVLATSGAPEHPTAADWRNRAERAEAECKDLLAQIERHRAILPSAAGTQNLPDSKVMAFYITLGELRAVRDLSAPGQARSETRECPSSPDGKHQVDTSMESGPSNCFYCEAPMRRPAA